MLARDGVEVSASQLFWQQQRHDLIESLPDLKALCQQQGRWLQTGDRLRQPALADTLEQLARHGVQDFYQGELGVAFAESFARLGCGLSRDDLLATRAELVEPISIRYRGGTLFNVAPPCQGLYTLQAMAALQNKALRACGDGSARYYHYLVEAIKQGLLRRNAELCDPAYADWDFRSSLSEGCGRDYAAIIDDHKAAAWNEPGRPADTVWMAATDAEGRTACLIQSLFHDFGSGCVLGDTGVLWQNRAAGFNADPTHPNAWAPGKRPAHTLNPSGYLADDGRQLFFGTQAVSKSAIAGTRAATVNRRPRWCWRLSLSILPSRLMRRCAHRAFCWAVVFSTVPTISSWKPILTRRWRRSWPRWGMISR